MGTQSIHEPILIGRKPDMTAFVVFQAFLLRSYFFKVLRLDHIIFFR